jgi:hypothetical protein
MFAEATLLNDGTVLITGGADISTSSTNVETWTPRAPELYDPPTGAFRTTGSMVTARVGTTATLLPNGRVLVTGGVDDRGTTLSSAELYDPKTGEFSVTGSMAGARAGHTATRLKDGRVLVAGGVADSSETPARTSAEVYDPTTGRFTSAGTMVTMRELHTATLLADGRVLIAGGVTSQVRPLESDPATYGTVAGDSSGSSWIPADTAELYDPASGTFSPTGSLRILSSERFVGHTATLLADGRVLLMGSMSLPAELYDPQSGAFSESGPSTNTWTQATVTPLPSGLVLIAGGFDVHEGGVAGAELYDPKTDTYSPTVPMATPRYGAAAALLPDGRVLILGGRSDNVGPSVMLDSAELYTPAGTRQ